MDAVTRGYLLTTTIASDSFTMARVEHANEQARAVAMNLDKPLPLSPVPPKRDVPKPARGASIDSLRPELRRDPGEPFSNRSAEAKDRPGDRNR